MNILRFLSYKVIKDRTSKINFNYLDDEPLIYKSEIGANVKVGKRTLIYKSRILGNNITIGSNTTINESTYINNQLNDNINIGNFCSIASHCCIFGQEHNYRNITTYYIRQRIFKEKIGIDAISKGDINICNDVWIGAQCIILSGVNIGNGCVIAANSTVTTDIPPYSIAVGVPARVIKKRFSDEIIEKLLMIKWWDWDINKIYKNHDLFHGDLTLEKLNNINQ